MKIPFFSSQKSSPEPDPFLRQFNGYFRGILQWSDLAVLWENMRQQSRRSPWYLYKTQDPPPTTPLSSEELSAFLVEMEKFLRSRHEEAYCGIVYADSLDNPSLVKIFDPDNLGVSCGFSDNPPLPGWVLSHLMPVVLPARR